MKSVFYVIYILFYTGAVFVTGLFVGQMLERSWALRRKRQEASESSAGAIETVARGTLSGREEATAAASKPQ